MLIYSLRRILYTLPIALGVSLICFLLVHMAPGDPLSAIAPADAPPEVVERLMEHVERARSELGDKLTKHEGTETRPAGRVGR